MVAVNMFSPVNKMMQTPLDAMLYKCKKLNSLKHRVRSQITRLKLQKSFCDLEHGVLL